MICSIGFYLFEADVMEGISESTSPHFGEYKPIGGEPRYHSTKGSNKEIKIKGRFIASSNLNAEILHQMARAKKPVRFTTATGISKKVVITNVSTEKELFLSNSGAVKIDFSISLKEGATGGFGFNSIIGAVIGAIF